MHLNKVKQFFPGIKPLMKRPIISWALYDFSSNSFAIVAVTVIYPVYFTNIVADSSIYGDNFGVLMWGIASGVSMLLGALSAPIFGTIADTARSKNRFLVILTLCCIFFTALLFFTARGTIIAAMLIFIAGNYFYQTSTMFYNSFLPELSDKTNVGTLSGLGFSAGYLGGLIMLAIVYPLVRGGIEGPNLLLIRFSFIAAAAFFLIFSLPSFIFLKDKVYGSFSLNKETRSIERNSYLKQGFLKLHKTFQRIRKDKNLLKFLSAYFLFSNAFSILAVYAAIYGRNVLNLSMREIVLFFIIGHFPVIISSFFFGVFVDRFGSKKVVQTTLSLWCIVIILISSSGLKAVFFAAFIIASIMTGSTLIASRSLMSFLTPVEREAEYFSFYAIGGKFSSILGPVTFGIIAFFAKSERIALLSTLIFLISGLIIVSFVKVPEKRNVIEN